MPGKRPHAGAPASISVVGWSPGPRRALAISVAIWQHGEYSLPAVEVLTGSRVVALAPNDRPLQDLTLGPHAVFLLATGAGDNPGIWQNGTYAA